MQLFYSSTWNRTTSPREANLGLFFYEFYMLPMVMVMFSTMSNKGA